MQYKTIKSYPDKDGNNHRGIEEELSELESDIARAGTKNARTGEEGSEAISLRSNSGLNEHHIPTPLHNYQK